MDYTELKELIELFSRSQVDKLDLEREGFSLKLAKRKGQTTAAPAVVRPEPVVVPVVPEETPHAAEASNLITIKSPIVGTFYRSPNPNAESFVQVGDQVKIGQTLCIVEAMKLMNEIQADYNGTIAEILVENGQAVEYDQDLFALKPL